MIPHSIGTEAKIRRQPPYVRTGAAAAIVKYQTKNVKCRYLRCLSPTHLLVDIEAPFAHACGVVVDLHRGFFVRLAAEALVVVGTELRLRIHGHRSVGPVHAERVRCCCRREENSRRESRQRGRPDGCHRRRR